jgi:hypothetical protein
MSINTNTTKNTHVNLTEERKEKIATAAECLQMLERFIVVIWKEANVK